MDNGAGPIRVWEVLSWGMHYTKGAYLIGKESWAAMRIQMYPCPHCAAEFDSFKSLENHLKAAHVEALSSKPFRCVTCDAEFLAQAEWLAHVEDEHSKVA